MDLAARDGVRPRKSLGQHFLADPNLARAVAREAGAAPGTRFLEIGAGLGSLTLALAEAGAEVVAIEVDARLAGALQEVTAGLPVRVIQADAARVDWESALAPGATRMASNLPYNVAVPVLLDLLDRAPQVDPFVVMVQREVGDRLAAGPGHPAYGAVSVRVALRAEARVVRRIGPGVFWPEPNVESVLVRLARRPPPAGTPEETFLRVVAEGFAQRRKTLAGALTRMGFTREEAREVISRAGFDPRVRAEELGLVDLVSVARAAEDTRG
jgi:16S rRNA (adenine1518-N6/adenine1519-N6)-dimethyltransferase